MKLYFSIVKIIDDTAGGFLIISHINLYLTRIITDSVGPSVRQARIFIEASTMNELKKVDFYCEI